MHLEMTLSFKKVYTLVTGLTFYSMIRLAIRSQKLNQMERELKVGDATNAAMVSSSLQKHQRRDHGKD